jgi:hypothetical protein
MHAALRGDRLHALVALLAGEQITLRKVDGWTTRYVAPAEQILDLAA